MGREEPRNPGVQAEVQGLARVLRELVPEPKLRADQGLSTARPETCPHPRNPGR